MFNALKIVFVLPIPFAFALFACGTSAPDSGESALGAAQLAVTNVPADVSCMRITAHGNTTVVRPFDVTPGGTFVLSASGLPVGAVDITCDAFSTACSAVTASSLATWVTPAPVHVTLADGTNVNVSLTLVPNGGLSASVDFDAGASPDGDASDACIPKSCVSFPGQCGLNLPIGCGGVINCACAGGQTCDSAPGTIAPSGTFGTCCTPKTCAVDFAGKCGAFADGCGGSITCGSCAAPQVCAPTTSTCCTPKTCSVDYAMKCGAFSNGCGGTIVCSPCAAPQVCAVASATCCTPLTAAAACAGKCGAVSDGCGGTISCGCVAPATCGGGGTAGVCG